MLELVKGQHHNWVNSAETRALIANLQEEAVTESLQAAYLSVTDVAGDRSMIQFKLHKVAVLHKLIEKIITDYQIILRKENK